MPEFNIKYSTPQGKHVACLDCSVLGIQGLGSRSGYLKLSKVFLTNAFLGPLQIFLSRQPQPQNGQIASYQRIPTKTALFGKIGQNKIYSELYDQRCHSLEYRHDIPGREILQIKSNVTIDLFLSRIIEYYGGFNEFLSKVYGYSSYYMTSADVPSGLQGNPVQSSIINVRTLKTLIPYVSEVQFQVRQNALAGIHLDDIDHLVNHLVAYQQGVLVGELYKEQTNKLNALFKAVLGTDLDNTVKISRLQGDSGIGVGITVRNPVLGLASFRLLAHPFEERYILSHGLSYIAAEYFELCDSIKQRASEFELVIC